MQAERRMQSDLSVRLFIRSLVTLNPDDRVPFFVLNNNENEATKLRDR